jgi:hypothetical protein
MLDVQCSMFDVQQFPFRSNWPLFRPAAGLKPDTRNLGAGKRYHPSTLRGGSNLDHPGPEYLPKLAQQLVELPVREAITVLFGGELAGLNLIAKLRQGRNGDLLQIGVYFQEPGR